MNRFFLTLIAFISVLAASAQDKDFKLKIGDFTEMTVANNINVVYKCDADSAGYAVYSCPKDIASAITFSNDRGKLKIQVISDEEITQPLPTITVFSLALTQATNWGDSTIYVTQVNPGKTFKAKVIGNGNIVVHDLKCTEVDASVKAGSGHVFLSGAAQTAKYTIMSAGAIEAGSLTAANVKCKMFGTGSIDCDATEKLGIDGLGSGKVFYKGNPTIKKHIAGVKVIPMQ